MNVSELIKTEEKSNIILALDILEIKYVHRFNLIEIDLRYYNKFKRYIKKHNINFNYCIVVKNEIWFGLPF